jgi:hypothetical protein
MHNCKSTQSSFIDLSLDELPPASTSQILAELNDCSACREEYAALTSTLRRSGQALRASLPGDEFWSGYHARLSSRLLTSQEHEPGIKRASARSTKTSFGSLFLSLKIFVTSSVRVPVPVALALMLVLGAAVFFVRPRGPVSAALSPQLPTVETRTITVPVVEEKVVTRVVYVEKKGRTRRVPGERSQPSSLPDSVARARSDASVGAAMSLMDFKPTDQIKLTITKGSERDEK